MISYLVATIPWTLGCLALTANNRKALRYRKIFAGCFFGTLVPMVYYFIQHKIHKVAGGRFASLLAMKMPNCSSAYTTYAFFEWALVLFDVSFDAVTALDFKNFELVVRDVTGASRGYVQWLPK